MKKQFIFGIGGLLVFLVFYSLIWPSAPIVSGLDSKEYLQAAQELSRFCLNSIFRTPGYPAFIALLHSAEKPSRFFFEISLVLHFLSVCFITGVLFSLNLSKKACLIFSLILVLPIYTLHAAFMLSETLSEFVLSLGFWGLWFGMAKKRFSLLVVGSLALALSGLVKPTYQFLPIALSITLMMVKGSSPKLETKWNPLRKAAITMLLGMVLIEGGFSLRNFFKYGYFEISPRLGLDLSSRTASYVERLPDKYKEVRELMIKRRDAQLIERGSAHVGHQYFHDSGYYQQLELITGFKGPALFHYLGKLNFLLIREAPLNYLLEVGRSFVCFWFPYLPKKIIKGNRIALIFWTFFHFGIIFLFAAQLQIFLGKMAVRIYSRAVGFYKRKILELNNPDRLAYLLAGVIVAYNCMISCAFATGDPRYRVPTDIFILFMTFLGGTLAYQSLVDEKNSKNKLI